MKVRILDPSLLTSDFGRILIRIHISICALLHGTK